MKKPKKPRKPSPVRAELGAALDRAMRELESNPKLRDDSLADDLFMARGDDDLTSHLIAQSREFEAEISDRSQRRRAKADGSTGGVEAAKKKRAKAAKWQAKIDKAEVIRLARAGLKASGIASRLCKKAWKVGPDRVARYLRKSILPPKK